MVLVSWRLTPLKRLQLPWPKGWFQLPARRWRSHVKCHDSSHTRGVRHACATRHPCPVVADHYQKCHPKKGSVWPAKLWSAKLPASFLLQQPSVRRHGCDEKAVIGPREPLHSIHLPILCSPVCLVLHTLTTPPNALLSSPYGAPSSYPQYGTADTVVLTLLTARAWVLVYLPLSGSFANSPNHPDVLQEEAMINKAMVSRATAMHKIITMASKAITPPRALLMEAMDRTSSRTEDMEKQLRGHTTKPKQAIHDTSLIESHECDL